MLPWPQYSALHLLRAMAPPTAPSGKARQTTLSGGWALNGATLWTSTRRSASPPPRSAAAQPLVYQITETTQLLLQRGDITRWEGDAIVNAGAFLCCMSLNELAEVNFHAVDG